MRLDLGIQAGDESKKFLAKLADLVERMEKAVGTWNEGNGGSDTSDDAPEAEAESEKPARRRRGKTSPAIVAFEDASEDETETELSDSGEDTTTTFGEDDQPEEVEEPEEAPAPKSKKGAAAATQKWSVDDVNDACMERAGRTNRAEVLSILKTKFKVKSVTDLKPEHYGAVIAAMKGKK